MAAPPLPSLFSLGLHIDTTLPSESTGGPHGHKLQPNDQSQHQLEATTIRPFVAVLLEPVCTTRTAPFKCCSYCSRYRIIEMAGEFFCEKAYLEAAWDPPNLKALTGT